MYELQLTVWPTDVDDIVEVVAEPIPADSEVTIVEDPIIVMPDMEDEYDTIEGLDDDLDTSWQPPVDEVAAIKVLENYHKTFGNGSEEYK